MKSRLSILVLLLSASLFGTTFVTGGGATVSTPGVRDQITGADMAGLLVTVTYLLPRGNGLEPVPTTYVWVQTGPNSGGFVSPNAPGVQANLSMSIIGATNGPAAWNFSSILLSSLLSIEFDGTQAGIFFDRTSPSPGTPGSGSGEDFLISVTDTYLQRISDIATVTYSNPVSVAGQLAQGDLYARMTVTFPCCETIAFSFTQDTDAAIPEPGSLGLALAGISFLAFWRRKRPC